MFRDRGASLRRLAGILCAAVVAVTWLGAQNGEWRLDDYRATVDRLIKEATSSDFAWRRLAELTDSFGHRLSGSDTLVRATAWAAEQMKRDGLENVRIEKVMVPRWVRGAESAEIVHPARHTLTMLGLGGSVATPPAGIEAEVVVVRTFTELDAKAAQVKGRIVVFNAPFTSYGETVQYRTNGASRAAQLGAVATLVRSVTPSSLRTPHTGGLRYLEAAPKIPAAAVTIEDAERLQRMFDRGQRIVVRLKMEAHFDADAESGNVVGEIVGREKPDEIVLLGGHFDSWDVGAGASDDGVGCVVTWEAARVIKKLGLRPRRTLRVVLWTNEENGGRGGQAYLDKHKGQALNHVLAFESDSGVFRPFAFGFTGSDAARRRIMDIATLLHSLQLDAVGPNGGGADIGPIVQAGQIPAMSLNGDPTRYFAIHHTPADTVEKIAPEEVSQAAAGIAAVVYVVAEMPTRLGQ